MSENVTVFDGVYDFKPPSFERNFVLADGTTYLGRIGVIDDKADIWIWPDEPMDFATAFQVFSDANKTSNIVMNYSQIEQETFTGYTKLKGIQISNIGKTKICMTKP